MNDVFEAIPMVISEIEISYKPHVNPSDCPRVTKSKDAYRLFIDTWDKKRFEFIQECRVMLLNSDHRVLGIVTVPRGSCVKTMIEPKLLFAIALKAYASEIIVTHNRLAGNLKPGPSDLELSEKLVSAGSLLDIKVADYFIITTEGFYSFSFEGVL